MLPKENRLTRKTDFNEVRFKGKNYSCRLFGLLVLEKQFPTSLRFGFVVSTKLSKKATLRNQAKRKLREAIKELLPGIKPGFDLVFLGKKELITEKYLEIFTQTKELFAKANLLK